MPDPDSSIAQRLYEAKNPCMFKDWEKKNGYYLTTCRVSEHDVPALIEIASKWGDPDWEGDDLGLDPELDDVELLPVSAWRALADLKSSEAVGPLIDILSVTDGEYDDWAREELPQVFGKIGSHAIAPLVQFANEPVHIDSVRSVVVEGLRRIGEYHEQTREEIIPHLKQWMASAGSSDVRFNTAVLVALVDLHAAEAAEVIERAFADNHLDVSMIGDWEYVRRELGVEGLGLEMPKHPHNSIEKFRASMGIGIFSDATVFDFATGECKPDAAQAYFDRASKLFSESQEAEQVVDRFGGLSWFNMFLQFGIDYLGNVVDAMSLSDIQDFVFDYVPRKVSTEAEEAAAIIFELTMFWQYLDRVFELPAAGAIVEWLKSDGLATELEAELSNPANFGMAKSMFMSGMQAGFDMTTEEGMAEFMTAYNRSVSGDAPPANRPMGGSKQRVGRNDPCPCGSGKKYKKCCRNR